jgi:hypothetical protein
MNSGRRITVQAAAYRELAQNLVFDEGEKLVVALVLVMVAVDVDDQDAVQLALIRQTPSAGRPYSPNTHSTGALPCIRSSGVRATRPRLLRGSGPPRPSQHRPEAMAMYCLPFTA